MTKFINPALVVAQTGLAQAQVVADLGCGNGFYVLPAAQMVGPRGTVFAVDIVESKLAATASIASQFGYKNVRIVKADLSKPLLQVREGICDLVIVGNIFHEITQREALIRNVYRILRTKGKVAVVEWKKTAAPFGPPLERRIEQQAMELVLMQAGFKKLKELEADSYHYAVLFEK